MSPLTELEKESGRMGDEFGPTNSQLYGDYYNYSIKKKSESAFYKFSIKIIETVNHHFISLDSK